MKWHNILALIVAICLSQIATGQNTGKKSDKKISVSGLVTDTLRRPVAGALILVDKKNTKIVTNDKGLYKVRVRPDADTITIITFNNGMSEAAIDGRTTINFTLAGSVSSLQNYQDKSATDEVVNIGYGNVDQKNLATTVLKKDGQSGKYATYMNIYEILKETPGVWLNGGTINIRGQSSFNLCTEPLFVVNGIVVSSLVNISPLTVESITVLKGAATSIYGSRGANGVILINLIK